MKAAVLPAIGQPLEICDVPLPTLGPEDVLVETHTCGICRTDIHIQDGLAYVPELPHVPGHEPAGVVAEVGERVHDIKVGQRVVPHLFLTCGACNYCRTGQDAQCSAVKGIIGVTTHGGFAEFFKAPAENLLLLPTEVPFDVGGLTSCAVVTAVHAYRRANLSVGDTALVLGTGGIGQILIQILKHASIRTMAISNSAPSLEAARSAGADLCLLTSRDAVEGAVQEFTSDRGASTVFECVGLGETMKLAGQCTARGGKIIVVGEEPEFPAIDTIQIAQRELEIKGSRNGSKQDAMDAMQWMARGIINPPIAAHLPLERINEGLEMVRNGSATGRVVIALKEVA